MTAWWQSLTTLEHALLYIAIPATLILVIQTILLFVGGGLGGEDCGDSPETDLGGDLDGAGDPDTGTDTAAESGSFEGMDGSEGEHPAQASGSLHLFTIRGIIAFLTLFSWGALWLCQLGLPGFAAVFLAVPIGFAGMVAIALIVREALRLQYDGTLDPRNALGRTGEVYLTVPAARSGTGKVTVLVQEQLREFEAQTDSHRSIPTGAPILVVGLLEETLLVQELTSQST